MNKTYFETRYKSMIATSPIEFIIELFRKNYPLELFTKNYLKDSIFVSGLFDLAIEYNRDDVVLYLVKNNYEKKLTNFYSNRIFKSQSILNTVFSDREIANKITVEEYAQMLKYCSKTNQVDTFDLICAVAKDKIKFIKKESLDEILIEAAKNDCKEMLLKLLHMKRPLFFDIEAKVENNTGSFFSKSNVLIEVAKNKNYELLEYLLTSPELEKNADFSESFLWIEELEQGREIINYIIYDIKVPLTTQLKETLLKKRHIEKVKQKELLFKVYTMLIPNRTNSEKKWTMNEYLEMFEKRDFMLKINEKLPIKNKKTKVTKI